METSKNTPKKKDTKAASAKGKATSKTGKSKPGLDIGPKK